MTNTEAKHSLLQWRGLMANAERRTRSVAVGVLALACGALVFCQLGFFSLFGVRVIALLAIVAVGALLYGTKTGTLIGLVAGSAAFAHALIIPLDYYEKYFAAPASSIVLFTAAGFIMGLLFAWAQRFRGNTGTYMGALALTCLVGSWFASTWFQLHSYLVTALVTFAIPEELFAEIANYGATGVQILLDAALMFVCVVGAVLVNQRRESLESTRTIRETFQGWLGVVMLIAFLFTAASEYTALTYMELKDANEEMGAQIEYLASQLEERDSWLSHIEENAQIDANVHNTALAESAASIASNLRVGAEGVAVVAEDGLVVSSNRQDYVGQQFASVVGAGLRDGFSEDLYNKDSLTEFYIGNGTQIGYMRAAQIGYVRVEQVGSYQIMVAQPASTVFASRSIAMAVVTLVFLLLFGAIYVLASRLLNEVVVRRIDETNDVLGKITEGDLEQTVDVHDTVEFAALSSGINQTVGALKGSIAEAEARIDRELATAKAIQESALPRTFPPFPEVERFDIFASMEPAREVGGDFYDFFLLEDNKLGMVVADVSGKGIPAALFMMAAKTEIEACMASGMPLDDAIATSNWQLCQGNDAGMFVTVFAAVLDYNTGVLQYVNAGHNPPLVRRGGTWEWLREKSGLFLGAFEATKYTMHETTLGTGDALFIYTDGVTEAWDEYEALYGESRLETFLSQHTNLGARKLVEAVRRDLLRYANGADQADDITMLVVEYGTAPEVSASVVLPARIDELEHAQAFVHGELARRSCPISVQNKIDICMEELFVNVANYAYPHATDANPGNVRVSYTYHPEPQGITVEISDEGVPFDPLAKPDPMAPESIEEAKIGGLGIFMTKQLAEDVQYVYRDKCNVTSFTKNW